LKIKTMISALLCATFLGAQIPVFASETAVNIKDYGAVADGTTDNSDAIQRALDDAYEKNIGVVYIPTGTFVVQKGMTIPTGTTLRGDGIRSVIKTTQTGDGETIFKAEGQTLISVSGVNFQAVGDSVIAIGLYGCDRVDILNNYADCSLVKVDSLTKDDTEKYSEHIHIKGNQLESTIAKKPAMMVYGAQKAIIEENIVKGYQTGVSMGRAYGELPIAYTCAQNEFFNIAQKAIYANRVERLSIGSNTVRDSNIAMDISDCYMVSVSANAINEITECGIRISNGGTGINLQNNTFFDKSDAANLIDTVAEDASAIYDLNITGNSFHNYEGGISAINIGNLRVLSVTNNHFYNTKMDLTKGTVASVMVNGNQMIFETGYADAYTAMKAGKIRNGGQLILQNNQIYALGGTAAKSCGIEVYQDDATNAPTSYLKGNSVTGFDVDIRTNAQNPNKDVKPVFILKNNNLMNANFERIEGSAQASVVRLEENFTAGGLSYPNQVPTTGKWEKGQLIYFAQPTKEGYVGAVCVAKGTPGIWKYFGEIQK